MGKKLYNYLFSSEITLIDISDWISGCRFTLTLKLPSVLISLIGCINEGLIFIFSNSFIIFAISVGLTDP